VKTVKTVPVILVFESRPPNFSEELIGRIGI